MITKSWLDSASVQAHLRDHLGDNPDQAFHQAFRDLPGAKTAETALNHVRFKRSEVRDLGHVREIRFTLSQPRLPLHLCLSGWIDDCLGRASDNLCPAPVLRPVARSAEARVLNPLP